MPSNSTDLIIINLKGGRYLANISERPYRNIVYSAWGYYPDLFGKGKTLVTERPYYEVAQIPPRSRLLIEAYPAREDGPRYFRIEQAESDLGPLEGPVLFRVERAEFARARVIQESRTDWLPDVDVPRRLLRKDPTGIISDADVHSPGDHAGLVPLRDSARGTD
jgi:hypothetical protein